MPKSVMPVPMPLPMPMPMDPGYLLQHRVAHEQDATAAETSADRGPIERRQLAPVAQWSGGSWHLVRVRVRVRVRISNQWADRAEAAGTGAATTRTHRLPAAAAPRARRWSSSPLASASLRPCRCRARAWLSMCLLPGRHVHAMCMASAQQTCGTSMPQRYHLQMPYACRIHGC
eukprot:scaffold106771_cov48-Phaeocystis_antarctica.AAC.1